MWGGGEGGTIPDIRNSLMIAIMVGIKSSRHSCASMPGRGKHDARLLCGFKDDLLHLLLCHKGEVFKSDTAKDREVSCPDVA